MEQASRTRVAIHSRRGEVDSIRLRAFQGNMFLPHETDLDMQPELERHHEEQEKAQRARECKDSKACVVEAGCGLLQKC